MQPSVDIRCRPVREVCRRQRQRPIIGETAQGGQYELIRQSQASTDLEIEAHSNSSLAFWHADVASIPAYRAAETRGNRAPLPPR